MDSKTFGLVSKKPYHSAGGIFCFQKKKNQNSFFFNEITLDCIFSSVINNTNILIVIIMISYMLTVALALKLINITNSLAYSGAASSAE